MSTDNKETENKQCTIPSVSGSADFWGDARTFLESHLPKDFEEKLIQHAKDKGYNENEFRLFKSMMQEAAGYYGTMVILKHYH